MRREVYAYVDEGVDKKDTKCYKENLYDNNVRK